MIAPGTSAHPETWPPHIRERYGVTRRPRWIIPVALVAALGAVIVSIAWVRDLTNPRVAAGIAAYQTLSDDHMVIEFQVQRRDSTPVVCAIRARATDGFDVGYAVVDVPAGQGRTTHTYDLRTAYRGFVGELLGCGVDELPANTPGAKFRPGVVPPEQPWTQSEG